jgi:hypothetical protein
MAADVVFTAESPWYTNSHTWNRITEYALNHQAGDEFHGYLDTLGLDFTFLSDDKAAEIARWLSEVIERMLAGSELGSGEQDHAHARKLIAKLNSELRIRSNGSSLE